MCVLAAVLRASVVLLALWVVQDPQLVVALLWHQVAVLRVAVLCSRLPMLLAAET